MTGEVSIDGVGHERVQVVVGERFEVGQAGPVHPAPENRFVFCFHVRSTCGCDNRQPARPAGFPERTANNYQRELRAP